MNGVVIVSCERCGSTRSGRLRNVLIELKR